MAVKSIFVKQDESSNRLECGTCKQIFTMTCKYIDHIAQHKNFVFSCNICNKRFSGQKQLDEHYVTHKEVNTYDCKECNRRFLQKSDLEQHTRFHIKLLSSSESPEKIKKAVRFSSTIESRTVDDDFSSTASYLKHRLTGPNGEGTTRSGRTVKIKRFDDGPQVKRKCPESVVSKASVNLKDVEKSPRLTTASKTPLAVSSTSAKDVFNKKLVILCEKLPDHVFKMYSSKVDTCGLESSKDHKSINKLVSSNSETGFSNASNSAKLSKNFSQKQLLTNNSNSVMHLGEQSSDVSTLKNSNCLANISDKHCLTTSKSPTQLSVKPAQTTSQITGKKNNAPLRSQFTLPSKNVTPSSPEVASRCDKQFMYVGPKQDINKIKTVIEKVITTPIVQNKERFKEKSYGLSPNKNGEGFPKAKNSNNINKNSSKRESGEMESSELKSTDGILEKTVVKDFVFIKVTPELMDKMQKKSLGLSQKPRSSEPFIKADPENISQKPPSPSKFSHTAIKNETSEVIQTETLVPIKRKDGNSESSTVNTSTVVSPATDKISTSQLITKVQREMLVFPQKSHGNFKPSNAIEITSISPVSSNFNKNKVKEVLCTTGGIGTPQLGEKIQSKTLESSRTTNAKNISSGKDKTPELIQANTSVHRNVETYSKRKLGNILPVASNLNIDISKNSDNAGKRSMKTTAGDVTKFPKVISMPTLKCKNLKNSKTKVTAVNNNKAKSNNFDKEESERIDPRIKEKLLERYRAKLEEKERKKKEKYEWKKKMKYLEKTLGKNRPDITICSLKKSSSSKFK